MFVVHFYINCVVIYYLCSNNMNFKVVVDILIDNVNQRGPSAGEQRAQQARVQAAGRQQRQHAAPAVRQPRRPRLHRRRPLACRRYHSTLSLVSSTSHQLCVSTVHHSQQYGTTFIGDTLNSYSSILDTRRTIVVQEHSVTV